jgi:hypothetical protein
MDSFLHRLDKEAEEKYSDKCGIIKLDVTGKLQTRIFLMNLENYANLYPKLFVLICIN